jgi:outer membrane protein OmpA-like peptidoglycan-associated protein
MRILITGFVILVIWSFFSTWLYVDVLKPQTKKQVVVQPVPENQNREADSLAKLYASMPKELWIFFDFDKSKMLPGTAAESSIAEFKAWMAKYPATILTVTGRTDFIGKPEYNQKLATERADIVKKFLESKGIPSDKIVTLQAEQEKSLINQITSGERAQIRRTEVTIKK